MMFLKLGGSLLGDKRKRRSFRAAAVERVGREIAAVVKRRKNLRFLLAHGGGGAAHHPAAEFRVRDGLQGGGGWRGFAETRRGVLTSNCRVLDALGKAGVYPVLIPPVAGVVARNGRIVGWDTRAIEAVLRAGEIPLIHGDVVMDEKRGFGVCSTEELFEFLAPRMRPRRVVLACDVEGVYVRGSDSSDGLETDTLKKRVRLVRRVDASNIAVVRKLLRRHSELPGRCMPPDVTGGMLSKVEQLFAMARRLRALEARIVSGLKPGAVEAALLGEAVGTLVVGS